VKIDNVDVELERKSINHEEMLKTIQMEFRRFEAYLRNIDNREMELGIVRLQESAHWAFQAIMRDQSEKMEEKKDG
jgi:hypothetical protein